MSWSRASFGGRWRRSPRALLSVSFGGTSVLNYGFGLAAGWLLAPGDFGLLAFAQTVLLIAGLILNAGFPWALTLAAVHARGERRAALVRGALLHNLLLASLLAAALVLAFAAGPLRAGLEQPLITAMLALTLPLIAVAAVARHAAQAAEHYGVVALIGSLEIAGKTVIGLLLLALGFGVAGAAAGFACGAGIAALVGILALRRRLAIPLVGSCLFLPLRAVLPMFGGPLGLALLLNLDLAALKLLGGDRGETGLYQAGLVLANAPYFLVSAALVPVLFSRSLAAGDRRARQRLLGESVRLVALLIVPLELVLIAAPDFVLARFFPAAYADGATVLRLLAIGTAVMLLVALSVTALQAAGRTLAVTWVMLAVAAAEAVALWRIVPARGAAGSAMAFVVAASVSLAALAGLTLLSFDRTAAGRAALWAARYAVALAGGALTYAVLVAGTNSPPAALIGSGLAYAGLSVCLRLTAFPVIHHHPRRPPAAAVEETATHAHSASRL